MVPASLTPATPMSTHSTPVHFTPDIALGVFCLVTYNLAVAAVGLLNHSRIPER